MSRARLALLAAALLLLAAPARADDKLTPEDREAFEWLSTVGLPDVKDKPYVRIHESQGKEQDYEFTSWLLAEDADSVHVFGANLAEGQIPKGTPREGVATVTSLVTIDLATFARGYLDSFHKEEGDHWDEVIGRRLWGALGFRAEIFVLAWGCWRNGLDELAHELRAEAVKLKDRSMGREDLKPFLPVVQQQIAARLHWQAAEAFVDPKVSRKELLALYERVANHFPDYDEHKDVADTAATLARMVDEEAKRAARPPAPFDSLTEDEKVAELVYRLRDDPQDASKQLVAIGLAAVPRLIEALDDQSFTRKLHHGMKAYNRPWPERVWEVAKDVLEALSGRGLWDNDMYGKPDGPRTTAQRLARAWWEEVRTKGEKQLLVEETSRGEGRLGQQAALLVKRYPDAALPALETGYRNAKDEWVRSELLGAAARLDGDAPVAFLSDALAKDSALDCRIAAARGLLRHGRKEGIARMIDEWRATDRGPFGRDLGGLIGFLAWCGAPGAVDALGEKLRERPLAVRFEVVQAFAGHGRYFRSMLSFDSDTDETHDTDRMPLETRAAIEKLLVAELEDTEERTGSGGSWAGQSYQDPRVCDFAGMVLWMRGAERFPFELGADQPTRDRQRFTIINRWRSEHGLTPLDAPAARRIEPAPARITKPLLDRLVSTDPKARLRAAKKLEAIGLAALPALEERLHDLDASSAIAAEVAALTTRVGCIVAVTSVTADSVAPTTTFVNALRALEGKPLTAHGFVDLVKLAIRENPKDAHGAKIEATRSDDGFGVTLVVTFLAVEPPEGGGYTKGGKRMPFCDTTTTISLGREALQGSGGSGDIDFQQEDRAYEDVFKCLDRVLAASPRTPFIARIKVALHPGE